MDGRVRPMGEDRPVLTGLMDLDRVTGGGAAGDLWVVSGPAQVGKTTLLMGMARAALRTRVPVRWVSTDEEVSALMSAMRSAEARVPVERLGAADLTGDEQARLAAAEVRIGLEKMTCARVPAAGVLDAARRTATAGGLIVVDSVADRADVWADLRGLAVATGSWVVVVVPRPALGRRPAPHLVGWRADVHVCIEREDLCEPDSPRVGEADLWVATADRTRAKMVTVAVQGRYSRLIDLVTA